MKTKMLWPVLVTLLLAIIAPSAAAEEPQPYSVQPDDSLTRIAAKFSVTISGLVDANRAIYPCLATKPTCLQIGWRLRLPGSLNHALPTTIQPAAPIAVADPHAFEDMRTAVAAEVNRLRADNGLPQLVWDEAVANAAQYRSQDMAIRNYFSHFDPVTGAIAAAVLLPGSAYSPACENIYGAWGRDASSVVSTAINMWWNSPGHKRCMLMPRVTVIGVGIAQDSKGGWLATLINARPK